MQQRVSESIRVSARTTPTMINVIVRLVDGGHFSVPALAGSRAIDAIRDFGLPLRAECAGLCLCTGCHVRVAEASSWQLDEPEQTELARLREVPGAGPTSRLICRLILAPEHDGLDIEIDPASLVPQTYWTAG